MVESMVIRDLAEIAKEVDRISRLPPDSPELKPLREMLEELDKGLPLATSEEVLSSRCKW